MRLPTIIGVQRCHLATGSGRSCTGVADYDLDKDAHRDPVCTTKVTPNLARHRTMSRLGTLLTAWIPVTGQLRAKL